MRQTSELVSLPESGRKTGWRVWAAVVVVAWLVAVALVFSRPFSDFVPAAADPLVTPGLTFEVRCGAVLGGASTKIVSVPEQPPEQPTAVMSRTPCEAPRKGRQRMAIVDLAVGVLALIGLGASAARHRR